MPSDTDTDRSLAPPYAAFSSVKTTIAMFKEHGTPNRVDASLLKNFSGSVIKQVISALRFLGLIDEKAKSQPSLKHLCDSYGTEQWANSLSGLLRQVYGPMFEIDLAKATAGEINQRFRDAFSVDGETLRKALTFFLNACREGQVTLSPYVQKGAKPRSGKATKRKSQKPGATAKVSSKPETSNSDSPPLNGSGQDRDVVSQLLGKFPEFDPEWPDTLKTKWFDGFAKFMALAETKNSAGGA